MCCKDGTFLLYLCIICCYIIDCTFSKNGCKKTCTAHTPFYRHYPDEVGSSHCWLDFLSAFIRELNQPFLINKLTSSSPNNSLMSAFLFLYFNVQSHIYVSILASI